MVNGKSDSSTWFDRHTLKLLAHLPGTLIDRRERVMIVGLGTGVTAGEFALYPDVRSIEVAEISPAVAGFLPLFELSTGRVQEDPRLAVHVADAFQVIGRSRTRWDIIVSEPSNPWVNGVDQLFSREFYRLVREHLEPGGLFVQWFQRYATSDTIAGIVVDTVRSEFPHLRLFRAEGDDLLLASMEPIDVAEFDRATALLQENEALRESLDLIDVHGPDDLRALEHPELLERLSGLSEGKLETLDHPRIHHMSARAHFLGQFLDDE
jgi:spermidine synthase